MTELAKLRKQKEEFEWEISELNNDISRLDDEAEEARERIAELQNELADWQSEKPDTSTMINSMKYDKLIEIWDKITLEDLEAIGDTVS